MPVAIMFPRGNYKYVQCVTKKSEPSFKTD